MYIPHILYDSNNAYEYTDTSEAKNFTPMLPPATLAIRFP